MAKSRLEEQYSSEIRGTLQGKLGLSNIMQVPRLEKIVVNVGIKDAITDSKAVPSVAEILAKITGQRAVRTLARKSIAGFKLREGMPIGVKVTLRRQSMYEFLDRLINLALPTVRDFQGIPYKFDRRGNYNLGIKEWVIFPEIDYDTVDRIQGMNITFHTSATKDEHGLELLKSFGMPFKKA